MKEWKQLTAVAAFAAFGASGAGAAVVVCGDPDLGLRITTVDPALQCTYAGLGNLGDPELEALMDTLVGADAPSAIIERDTGNSNGGDLNITGVGGSSGTWSFDPAVWDNYGRVFLYFHFGDAQDNPGPGSTTDPDVFIVELLAPPPTIVSGSWSFGGGQLTGLSNIALIGAGANGNGNGNGGGGGAVPEPATLALVGLGLLGAAAARRRSRV